MNANDQNVQQLAPMRRRGATNPTKAPGGAV